MGAIIVKVTIIFVLVLGLTFAFGQWLVTKTKTKSSPIVQTLNISSCDPTKNTCEIEYKKTKFILEFKDTVSGLVPFEVLVKSNNTQPDSITLSFDMQGMDMGYNLYNLKKNRAGWSAMVILPVCSLGRNDWLMRVKLLFESESHVTEFKFTQPE